MNRFLTYCAQAKLLRLLKKGGAASARLIAFPEGGVNLELDFSIPQDGDIMLSRTPRVYTDLFTFKQLTSGSVDFDYPKAEFVITRERNERPSHPQ